MSTNADKPKSDNAARQRKFRENMKARGMVQVTLWVPQDRKGELVQHALDLQAGHH